MVAIVATYTYNLAWSGGGHVCLVSVRGLRVKSPDGGYEIGPTSNDSFCRRQRVDQSSPVSLGYDTRVGDDHDAAVGAAANEPPKSLLESKRRMRKHVLGEGVSATRRDRFTLSGGHGLR